MRGSDRRTGSLFSYVDLEDRVPAEHPLRLIRGIVDGARRSAGLRGRRYQVSKSSASSSP
jgi:hypothetical protein